jgi:hypothetical protein
MSRLDKYFDSTAKIGERYDYHLCWMHEGVRQQVGTAAWLVEPLRRFADEYRAWMGANRDMMGEFMRGTVLNSYQFLRETTERLAEEGDLTVEQLERLQGSLERIDMARGPEFLERVRDDLHEQMEQQGEQPEAAEHRVEIPTMEGEELEAFLDEYKKS